MKNNLLLKIAFQILLFQAILFTGCTSKFTLREGDLLFQDLDCGPMCDAIEEVTQGIDGAKFSHVGIVVLQDQELKVAEAVNKGVTISSIPDFLTRSKDSEGNPKVLVGRLKKEFRQLIPSAMKSLPKYLNAPYDGIFDIENETYYCSELVYFIYKDANDGKEFFPLYPMTFKSPETGNYFPVWVEYYNQWKLEIPEGMPGLNPGGISRDPKIEIVHTYGKPDGWHGRMN